MVKLDPRLGLASSPPVLDSEGALEAADQVVSRRSHTQSKGSLHVAAVERAPTTPSAKRATLTTPLSWEC